MIKKLFSMILIFVLLAGCALGEESSLSPDVLTDNENPFSAIAGLAFSFCSGAGAWETVIAFDPDGSFSGNFHDADMGDTGEGYPYGTLYYCNFTGTIAATEESRPWCRKLQLVSLERVDPETEPFVEDEVLYVPAGPYGLEKADTLWLYQPDTPLSALPEDFLPWAQLWDVDQDGDAVLGKWGLYNENEEYGFVAPVTGVGDGNDTDGPVSGFFDVIDEEPFFVHSENGTHYGYETDYWEGCSVWCAVAGYSAFAEASSVLAPQGQYSYEAVNICSGDRNNAWVEGAKGDGVGEYINIIRHYEVSDADYGVDFRELCVVNGYARTPETWKANGRVQEMAIYFDGRYVDTITLEDTVEPQYFDLAPYGLHADSGADTVFHFEINSVYPGEKYADTALTGIEIDFWTPNH